jgi:protein gp37
MNEQKASSKSSIEWTRVYDRRGYTWNPVRGCKHACRWHMPDGSTAVCYAETVAKNVAQHAYPNGFEHHYWTPSILDEPLKLKTPSGIFLDSMSDLMGAWVPDAEVEQVLDICRQAHWHTFQLLTKNAPRLLKFKFPPNVWVGVSAPPSFMFGKPLSAEQQHRMVTRQLETLRQVDVPVRWMSIEPLSFDIAPLLVNSPLEWAVIGAASNGNTIYQPEKAWVENVLHVLDAQGTKVFFKGNLEWQPWREEFPTPKAADEPVIEIQPQQMTLFDRRKLEDQPVNPAPKATEQPQPQRLIWDKRYDAGAGCVWVLQPRIETYVAGESGHKSHSTHLEYVRLPKTSPIAKSRAQFLAGLKIPALREAYHEDFKRWQQRYVEIPDYDLSLHQQVDDRYLHFSYASNSVTVETVTPGQIVPLIQFVQMGKLMTEVWDIAEHGAGDIEPWHGMTTRSKDPYCLRFLGDERLFLIGGQHRYMALLLNMKQEIRVLVDRIPLTLEEARKGSDIKPPGLNFEKNDFDADYWNIADVLEGARMILEQARERANV